MLEKENLLTNKFKNYLKHLSIKFLGVIFVFLSIYLLFSILSYTQTDNSINTSSNFQTSNLCGSIGSTISNIFLYFFGISSLIIIYNIYLTGIHFAYPQKLNKPIQKTLAYMLISLIPTTLSLSYISDIIFKTFPTRSGLGGLLGLILKTNTKEILNTLNIPQSMNIVIFLLSTLVSLITLYFALDLTTKSIIKFENFTRYSFNKTKNLILLLFKRTPKQITIKPQKSKILNIAKKIAPPKPKEKISIQKTPKPTQTIKQEIKRKYILPSTELLKRTITTNNNSSNKESNIRKAQMLENILEEYKLNGKITNINTGPVITLFEMEPGPGIKTSQIKGLNEDIARKIEAISARIAVIAGSDKIGIELPNLHRQPIGLREQLESQTFKTTEQKLPISLGVDTSGKPVFVDLATMPHLLIAGCTGSGKSVGVNGMILSLLYKHTPDECKFIMIDPKVVELSIYNNIPHLLIPVVSDKPKAAAALKWAVYEMEERYRNMATIGAKNIESFNNKVKEKPGQFISRPITTGFDSETGQPITEDKKIELKPMPYIVIIVDEFADIMQYEDRTVRKEFESAVACLAAKARATGIHLILATQRPSVDVITGTIKSNFPTRVSYRLVSGQDSRTILNENGAELLLGKGDMLYMSAGGNTTRIHGSFVSEKETEDIVSFIKSQGTPNYVKEITEEKKNNSKLSQLDKEAIKRNQNDDLYNQAVDIILQTNRPSISYLQRQLGIGYNKSANLIERMEREGILSQPDSTGKRTILKKN